MNLPDVSAALLDWTQPLLLKTVTETTVRFEPVIVISGVPLEAVVQPTKKTLLNAGLLDWSRTHLTFHTEQPVNLGQFVEVKGKDYKIIEVADYSDYGYYEAVGEATNNDLIIPDPEPEP